MVGHRRCPCDPPQSPTYRDDESPVGHWTPEVCGLGPDGRVDEGGQRCRSHFGGEGQQLNWGDVGTAGQWVCQWEGGPGTLHRTSQRKRK